ncbi:DUF1540 domain-containing protein [Deinococcus actinosclerus]|uniref:DUF1540 domain-containing protein n=1 Tax=Deinococcus actinosclerus TaxID=1768108 RepID=A0ABM5X810_9DEIO|nr:DUF1540 domain-containing protein [Deinococcus actinosclerus]ALW89762.1 hypothetical protein AUC44_13335 [Deinococcus actinosclerus]
MNDESQSLVSRCDATTCRFNDNMNCTAGQIEVSMSGQTAQCLTFSPTEGMGDTQSVSADNH